MKRTETKEYTGNEAKSKPRHGTRCRFCGFIPTDPLPAQWKFPKRIASFLGPQASSLYGVCIKQKFLLISHFLRAGRPRSIILNFFPEKNQKRLFFPRFPATIAKSWIIVPCFFHFSLKKGEFSCLALSRLFCPFCPPPL